MPTKPGKVGQLLNAKTEKKEEFGSGATGGLAGDDPSCVQDHPQFNSNRHLEGSICVPGYL